MIPDYELIQSQLISYYKTCPVCKESLLLNTKGKICLHHMLHNTKSNRKNYPLFLNSPANLLPYHQECQGPENRYKITPYQAGLFEEIFLAYKNMIGSNIVTQEESLKLICNYSKFIELESTGVLDIYTFGLSLGLIFEKTNKKLDTK